MSGPDVRRPHQYPAGSQQYGQEHPSQAGTQQYGQPNPYQQQYPAAGQHAGGRHAVRPPHLHAAPPRQGGQVDAKARFRKMLPGLVVGWFGPILAYTLLSKHIDSDTTRIAVSASIPAIFTLLEFAWHRKLDPFGVIGVIGFGLALAVMVLTGGNSLVVKLHDSVISGPVGLIMLFSAAIRRPLLGVIVRIAVKRRDPRLAEALDRIPSRQRTLTIMTALIGGLLAVHALVLLILAVSLPTSTCVSVSRPVGIAVLAVGALPIVIYRRKLRARREAAEAARA